MAANENAELGKIPISHSQKRLFLMQWTMDGVTYGNHYLLGFPAFALADYQGWLPQITALLNDFRADEIDR
ncbi:hypothetical protein GCM10008018_06100 [Paenibacillus marchantiophytorum]|uniref:Uncharacterized protein n=1 Tax=Paenibacillus marchantiophytorum TaxID=1619310 RepID=A0ABQ2BR61_9BACL|nr:hypothetical protein [Paenibacillus marchantiophytorum]GGI44237.1 hypothetical protein GCM10008018_06100 [Paenibacillus marchantiophytorum]